MSKFYRPGQVWNLPRITKIQETICEAFDLSIAAMVTKARPRHLAHPRQIAMALCRELTHYSLEEIGRCFGGRDHGTVLHAMEVIKNECATNPKLFDDVNRLRHQCLDRLGIAPAESRLPNQIPLAVP